MPRPSRSALLALSWLLPAAACGSGFHVAQRRTFTLQSDLLFRHLAPALFELQFHSGLLVVEPGERLACEARIELSATDDATIRQLAATTTPTIDEAADGSRTVVRTGLPPGQGPEAITTTYRLVLPKATRLLVRTRTGNVVVRAGASTVRVEGGSGSIEAQMDGAPAYLETTSGNVALRGNYPFADVRSQQGRIDVQMPPAPGVAFDTAIESSRGEVYLELQDAQLFDLDYRGEVPMVNTDPAVRIEWGLVEEIDGVDHTSARIGDLQALLAGKLHLHAGGLVHLRLAPQCTGK